MKDLSLPVEYEQSWCEVKTAENELIAVGRIKTIKPKYMIIYDKDHKMPSIQIGTLVKINVFNPNKEIRVCIGNIYIVSGSELSLVNVISLVNNEKRNFFRVKTDIETEAIYREYSRQRYPSKTDITILDMSLNGLQFKSTIDFKKNDVVGIVLKFKHKKEKGIIINCEIVRLIDEKKDGYQNYGCRIVMDENIDIDTICTFLFDKQREFISHK